MFVSRAIIGILTALINTKRQCHSCNDVDLMKHYWLVYRDGDIAKKCGQDAIQYLTFQRYLLLYLVIICVLSTAIIVPVNFTGTNSK